MHSVNPFGNSTLSCNVGSIAFSPECPWIALRYKKWLEEFGFKQYWNLFLAAPPFARDDIPSSSGHWEAPSTFFFFLHSSIMSLYWNAPSLSRWSVWSCRGNRVMALDTSKHFWSFDRCASMSVHLLSRTGMETGVSVTVGFCLGLALAMVFPKLCPPFPWSASILSRSYQHHSRFLPKKRFCLETDTWLELHWCIGLHDGKLLSKTGPILVFLRIHPLARVFFSLRDIVYYRQKCCISLFRQASNPHQSTVWIVSGLRTSVRIFARILAPSFTAAVHW